MSDTLLQNLLRMIGSARDAGGNAALLRFSIGSAYLKREQYDEAVRYLREAVERDPAYSAAWKQLGKALAAAGRAAEAIDAYERGIAAAQAHGDRQAVKEMTVFLRRLRGNV
jgi:tetratricopeptide (TPR) repeat protein